jgi:hypothetical protein
MLPSTYNFDFWNAGFLPNPEAEPKPNTLEHADASDGEGEDEASERGERSASSAERSSVKSPDATSPTDSKKKPRVTLARGGACVNCR